MALENKKILFFKDNKYLYRAIKKELPIPKVNIIKPTAPVIVQENAILTPGFFYASPGVGTPPATRKDLPFISEWQTSTPDETITLPYSFNGTYSGSINWGDGNISVNAHENRSHTYVTPGRYTVTITGTIKEWSFDNYGGTNSKLFSILQWGTLQLGNSGWGFYACNNLRLDYVVDTLDLRGITYLSGLFENCYSVNTINKINEWDVSGVTQMRFTFSNSNFDDDISNWDVSNVTNMIGMFESTYQFNRDISGWNVSNVTSMSTMFLQSAFNQPIGNWDVSKVVDMSAMFLQSDFNQDISGWNVSNVDDMTYMFYGSLFNQDIGGWDVGSVAYMSYMFSSSPFNQPIGNWDVVNVTTMAGMFKDSLFNQFIGNWNVSNVLYMNQMFAYSPFNTDISEWDVSKVGEMDNMFVGTVFNQPIGGWNVSNVQYMTSMFQNSLFDQDISGWNVISLVNASNMLNGGAAFSSANLDAIYNNWSLLTLHTGVIFEADACYDSSAQAGKDILVGTYGWVIADGFICTSSTTTTTTAYIPCLVKGTAVLLSDGTTKLIENITYEDQLAVWNFDEGKFDSAEPLWIKQPQVHIGHNIITFSDGSVLKTLQTDLGHRIFNIEKGKFTYPMTDDTPIGTHTFNQDGMTVSVISKEIVMDEVEYYNIISNRHMNLFTNSILTSCRYNNIYPIVDMKFVKDDRTLRTREEFNNVSDKYFEGLRLAEQTLNVNDIEAYVEERETLDVNALELV